VSAFDETFDYLTLLGLEPAALEFQPPAEVRDLINRRKKEWTGQAINPLYQQQARANLERARQFERILDQPDALHAYLGFHKAAQAQRRQEQDKVVGEFVAMAVGAGRKEISSEQHALLQKACEERGIPAEVLAGTLRARKLSVREREREAPTVGLPYREPALDRALMAQIAGHLRLLRKESFYELVDLPAGASPAKVISTARILYDRWSKTLPKTSECIAWEKSLQACLTYLKDGASKTRYDHALYNRSLDEFMGRVDLLLAAGRFSRDDFVLLATVGVQEFGLSNDAVNQAIRWRVGAKGLSLSKPIVVNVSTSGQVRCDRCFRYVTAGNHRCPHCGCAFDQHCRNPACGKQLSAGAKNCAHCGLSVGRGVQYIELLRLARALLNAGDGPGVLEACRLADQILPSPQIEELTTRATRVRALLASIRRGAADRRWSRVERELTDLLSIAPAFSQPGYPRLEEVSRFLGQIRSAVSQIPFDATPETEARVCLDALEKWTDGDEVLLRLRRLAESLERSENSALALKIARRFADLEPLSEEWQTRIARLQENVSREREHTERLSTLHEQFRQALAARRLCAAERSLGELEGLGAAALAEDAALPLRERLARIRAELEQIRQASQAGATADDLINRYLLVLEACSDCREALAALKSLEPLPPAPPAGVTATIEGTRRVIGWPALLAPSPDTVYVIERSVQRPGGKGADGAWNTIYEGAQTSFIDGEILHTGTIVRYAVHALRRGALTVAGNILREFAIASPPVFATPLLLWQEVHGLRICRRGTDWELNWHPPAAARQVLVERWSGLRNERPEQPQLLPVIASGRLALGQTDENGPVSFRVVCVYDGPEGDVLTPGAIVTFLPGGESNLDEPPPGDERRPQAGETTGANTHDGHAQPAAERTESNNPLKRMGLWPPVPKSG
jgi:hypothetical protein